MTLVDPEAAAHAAGVSGRQIRRLVQRGALTNHGQPRRILVDLDAAIAAVPRAA